MQQSIFVRQDSYSLYFREETTIFFCKNRITMYYWWKCDLISPTNILQPDPSTSQIHEKLKQYEKQSPTPVLHSASCLAEDVGATFPQASAPNLI